jgi:hypothetical protein
MHVQIDSLVIIKQDFVGEATNECSDDVSVFGVLQTFIIYRVAHFTVSVCFSRYRRKLR